MKKPLVIVILIALLVPTCSWWFSSEQVVKRRTKHLMEVLTISEGSADPLRQAKVFSMNAMLAPEVTLDIPVTEEANGTFDQGLMESVFSTICKKAKSSEFKVTEFRSIVIDGDTATVNVFVEGYMEIFKLRPVDGIYDVTIIWEKGEDGWRFSRVDWDDP
ncbi:MAG: nuclear transport factor 2 family protein [Akkermansiaceae bacterium]|jgi:hypothetical protein|nr:nuclear transport factor 2 family protein [Akkermansiaceae bacterium]MDP4645812.1 nuclear transport factor 2 family protein [Akkermansiaceae bacterium]MDP4720547.1 nuclear transport factor 2 family protein [Akkermansiaceae bacterium]MDP4779015.1 nuclear transport factor 2 family protein [Akkermansiaceae bacterium]MDP4847981.1 nuclear transport factor 2 family protein [Akkermansiaceae bacterium]